MKKIQILTAFSLLFLLQSCGDKKMDAETVQLKTRMDTISYIIGLDYGLGINEQEINVNQLAVYRGLLDGLKDTTLLVDSVKQKIIADFDEELKAKLVEKGKKFLKENKRSGNEFLNENRTVEGVIELENGLQYKVLKNGEGRNPKSSDSVLIHYRAMFVDQTVFDMSYDRGPAGFRINSVIEGLAEGVKLMNEGAIYELYIPPVLAYGDQAFANIIPAGSTLIYSIELIEIIKE